MTPARTNYDAAFCGKLPLHQTNMIQPHGVLLLLSLTDFTILQVSENISSLVSVAPADVIRKNIKDFVTEESFQNLTAVCQAPVMGKLPVSLCFKQASHSQECLAVIQEAKDYYLAEIELAEFIPASKNSFVQVFQKIKGVMSAIDAARTVQEIGSVVVKELKAVSGFDKVMMYTFDEEWNGSVLAEAMEAGMDSYLGLRFPASDIPKPARDLYLKTPYRIIPDREYQPVRLYPVLNPLTHTFTDLANSDLRSVAGVHLEYLKNMKVMASMSTRIVYDGKLWGLIACHHRAAKYLSFEQCSVFEWLSNVISAKITSLLHYSTFQIKERLRGTFTHFVELVYQHQDIQAIFQHHSQLWLQLLSADGVALCWNSQVETAGKTPDTSEVEMIRYWLQGKQTGNLYHQPALPHVMEEANGFAEVASGLLSLSVQAEKGNFILAFRGEVVKKVVWGGNPNEAISFEKDSTAYHPRHSFQQWQETVRHTSEPWLPEEIEMAETLRNYLVEYTLNKMDR